MHALLLAALLAQPITAQEDGFVSLSDDPALSAWRQPKDGAWQCENGVISKVKGGTLFSEAMYEDFALRFEYKIPAGGNSGVFLRAPLSGRHSALGMELQIMGDHGKPPGKGSSGALYDAKAPDVAATNPDGEWNEVDVDFRGMHLKVTLNGQVTHDCDLDDPAINEGEREGKKLSQRSTRGYIGLQDHGHPVEFRNVRIQVLPEEGFDPLFDGTLEGWTPLSDGSFAVQDGVLTCTAAEDGEPAFIKHERKLADHELRLEYRVGEGAEAYWLPRANDNPKNRPMEIVMADDDGRAPGLTASGALAGQAATMMRASRGVGDWNDLRVIFEGWSVKVFLNGMPVLNLPTANYFGKYMYTPLNGVPMVSIRKGTVEVRNVRVKG